MMNTNKRLTGCLVGAWILLLAMPLPAGAGEVAYEYDGLDRLTSANYDGNFQVNYAYDNSGNILMVWSGFPASVDGELPDLQYLQVLAPSPNPFNARVCIALEIKASQNVEVKIFDLRGRLVRRLINEVIDPGKARIFWDGCGDNGAALASGLYFAQVRTAYKTIHNKMMMIK